MRNRILLVEDHSDTRVVLSMLLRKKGYDVVAAESKKEALQICEHQQFDLLICDVGLGDESGYDVMRALATKCNIKGIAYTGFGMESDVAEARAAGFAAHLLKPVPNEVLYSTISRLIGASPANSSFTPGLSS